MSRKQTIMPVYTKVKIIYLLQAAVIGSFRTFQLLDFPKTIKTNIVQTIINTNWLFHAHFIFIKIRDFRLRLNILLFGSFSAESWECSMDLTHISHSIWGNLRVHSPILTYSVNKPNLKSEWKIFSRNNSIWNLLKTTLCL